MRARGDGLRLPGRLDGLRGGREVRPRLRPGRRAGRAAGVRRGLGRRAHAGEHPRAHADGQDDGRVDELQENGDAVHLRARPPDDRRRDRVVRGARRRRSWPSPDALHVVRRPARRAADDARDAARGLRPRRVQLRARARRPDRHPRRAARDARPPARPARAAARAEEEAPPPEPEPEPRSIVRQAAPPLAPPPRGERMGRVRAEFRGLRRRIAERADESDIWDAVQLARHDQPAVHARLREPAAAATSSSCTATAPACDDPAIVAGLGRFRGRTVALVGHQKGRDTQGAHRTATSAWPAPRATARRCALFELADRLGFPVITLIDTPGAYPGVRRRAARPGRRDRALDADDGAADGADRSRS